MDILELFQAFKDYIRSKRNDESPIEEVRLDKYKIAGDYYYLVYKRILEENLTKDELTAANEQAQRVKGSDLFDILVERNSSTYGQLCNYVWSAFIAAEEKYFNKGMISNKVFYYDDNFRLEDALITDMGIVHKGVTCKPLYYLYFDEKKNLSGDSFLLLPKDLAKRAINMIRLKQEAGSRDKLVLEVTPFREIVVKAASMGASDIHFSFTSKYFYTFFRIDGVLSYQNEFTIDEDAGKAFVRSVKGIAITESKGSVKADTLNTIDDGKIIYDDLGLDIRIIIMPEGTYSGRNAIVCRLLEKNRSAGDRKLSDFGYGKDIIEALENIRFMKSGLFMVIGETGTGKSTLCEMVLDYIPSTMRTLSMQDPIERTWEKAEATQFQLNFETSPLDLIKGFKRMDPDVIYLGEIRNDPMIISALVEGSRAGQLNVSTIHLPSIFSFYAGFKEVFGVSYVTSIDLTHFLAGQVLVRKLCSYCKIEDVEGVNKKELQSILDNGDIGAGYIEPLKDYLDFEESKSGYLRNKEGCDNCRAKGIENYGYSGRLPIYEFMKVSPVVKKWLRDNLVLDKEKVDAYDFESWACKEGHATNKLSIYIKRLQDGDVTVDDGAKREVLYG